MLNQQNSDCSSKKRRAAIDCNCEDNGLPSFPTEGDFDYFAQHAKLSALESRLRQSEQEKMEIGFGLRTSEDVKVAEIEAYKSRISLLERELKYMTESEAIISRRMLIRDSSSDDVKPSSMTTCQPSRDEIVVELEKKLAQADSQLAGLQNDIFILREDLLASQSDCKNYLAQFELFKRQRVEQIEASKRLSDELTETKQKLVDTTAELGRVRADSQIGLIMSNRLDELGVVKRENARLTKDNEHYKKLSFNNQLLTEKTETLEDRANALEKQRDQLLAHKSALNKFLIENQATGRDMTSQDLRNVDGLSNYCRQLDEKNADLEARLAEVTATMDEMVKERDATIEIKSQTIQKLKDYTEKQASMFERERSDLLTRTSEMEITLADRSTDLDNLQEKLHTVEEEFRAKDSDLTMCQSTIRDLESAIEATKMKYKTCGVDNVSNDDTIDDDIPKVTDEDCSTKDMEMTSISVDVTSAPVDLELGSPVDRSPRQTSYSKFAHSPLQRNLQRELLTAYEEIKELKISLAAAKDEPSTSYAIFHACDNPLSNARKRVKMEYSQLKSDNKKLLLRVDELEKIVRDDSRKIKSSSETSSDYVPLEGVSDTQTGQRLDLTMRVEERQTLEAKEMEISDLTRKIDDIETRNAKLREMQKAVTDEYRSTVTQLLGYQVKCCGKRTSRDPSVYEVASRFDKSGGRFRFQLTPDGNLELLDNEYAASWPSFIDKYLRGLNSIPSFLSAITLQFTGGYPALVGVDETSATGERSTIDEGSSLARTTYDGASSSSLMDMEQTTDD